jgi:hypothetical protein
MDSNFSLVALIADPTNCILAACNNGVIHIPDPFSSSGRLSTDRLCQSSLYLPYLLLHGARTGNYYLFFLRKDNSDQVIVWTYSKDFRYRQQDNLRLSTAAAFLRSQSFSRDADWIRYILNTSPHWKPMLESFWSASQSPDTVTAEAISTTTFASTQGLNALFLETLSLLDGNWACSPEALFAGIADRTDPTLLKQAKTLYGFLTAGLDQPLLSNTLARNQDETSFKRGQIWFSRLRSSLPLALARDALFAITGKHYGISPATGCWIAARQQLTVQCSDNGRTFRLFRYEESGVEFIELRDFGYVGTSTLFLLPWIPKFACGPLHSTNYGSWWSYARLPLKFWNVAIDTLRRTGNLDSLPRPIVVTNCSSKNLGHTIWNDLNGLLAWHDALNAANVSGLDQLVEPISVVNRFSNLTNRQLYLDFVDYCFSANTRHHVVEPSDALPSIRLLRNAAVVAPLHLTITRTRHRRIAAFFKAKTDMSRLPSDLPVDPQSSTVILVNIRGGNKMLLNLAPCLEATCAHVPSLGKPLTVLLECSSRDSALADNAQACLKAHNIPSHILSDLNPYQLHAALELSTVVIAPVGSALVLPTWIMNKRCVTHGDPLHMQQLSWWPNVVPDSAEVIVDNVFPVPLSSITADNPNKLYANYTVNPHVFAETVLKSLSHKAGNCVATAT